MKTFRNAQFGLEIDLPEEWPDPSAVGPDTLIFVRGPGESLNVVAGFLVPDRLLEYTQFEFTQYAQRQGFTDLEFGRISAGGRDHP
jgi:hypothetical protein